MADAATMETSMDFSSILEGGHFTFIVGSEKRRFELHSALVTKHSKPLRAMFNNSSMQESMNREVILDDIEPATFVRFAEYLYYGRYTLSALKYDPEKPEQTFEQLCTEMYKKQMAKSPGGFWFYCRLCAICTRSSMSFTDYPYENDSCKDGKQDWPPKCTVCKKGVAGNEVICMLCEEKVTNPSSTQSTLKGWSQFKIKRFDIAGISNQYVVSQDPQLLSGTVSNDLSAHAKLWIFADRYEVPALQQISLHELHRNLVAYSLKPESVKEIVELTKYVYENTFVTEPEADAKELVDGKSCELRDLVMTYLACQADALMEIRKFCIMLRGGGDVACDFAKALVNRED